MSKKEENKRNKKTLKMAILLAVFLLMLLFLLHQCSNKNNVREEDIEENILGNNTMNIETSKNVNDEIVLTYHGLY